MHLLRSGRERGRTARRALWLLLVSGTALASSAAQARQTGDWAGFRGGLVATLTFGSHSDSHTGLPPGPASNGDYTIDHGTSGWQAGAVGGYFWQSGLVVTGAEGDIEFGNSGGTETLTGVARRDGSGASTGNFLTIREHTDTLIDVRGVAGLAASRHFMPYVTAGWIYLHGHYEGQFHDATPSDFIVRDGAGRGGWTIGAGLACRLNPIWVVKAEYLYYDVGHLSKTSAASGGLQSRFDFGGTGSLMRLALTVRFP